MTRATATRARRRSVVLASGLLLLPVVGCNIDADEDPERPAARTSPPTATSSIPDEGRIEAGTYRVPASPWSVTDFTLTFPPGWTVQQGHVYAKHQDTDRELSIYGVVVDEIFTDACAGDGVPRAVAGDVEDLVTALLEQPGPEARRPVETAVGGFPATRVDLLTPEGLDLSRCRLGVVGLHVWYAAAADKGLILLERGVTSVYVVDVHGRRQVFVTQVRPGTTRRDVAELETVLASIRLHPAPPALPGPQAMAPRENSAGRRYGLSAATAGCDCSSILWHEDEAGRLRQVHTFGPGRDVTLVELAPDPRHGFALDAGGERMTWLRTSDGGRTWRKEHYPLVEVQPPVGKGSLYPPAVVYSGGRAYFLTRGEDADAGGTYSHLWLTPVARDRWSETGPATTTGIDHASYSIGLLAVTAGEPARPHLAMLAASGIAVRSNSGWDATSTSLPCAAERLAPYGVAGPQTMFVECRVGQADVQVWRSVNLGAFEAVGPPLPVGAGDDHVDLLPVDQPGPGALAVVQVDGGLVLLGPGSRQRTVVAPDVMTSTDLPGGSTAVGHGDGRTYVLVQSGVVLTDDGGRSWRSAQADPG